MRLELSPDISAMDLENFIAEANDSFGVNILAAEAHAGKWFLVIANKEDW